MKLMARRKDEPIDREAERRKPDVRGITAERLSRVGTNFEVGDDKQGTKVFRVIEPLERMRRDGRLTGPEYSALQKYKHHWYHSGLLPTMGSVDLNRVFASDVTGFSGMAKSEAQAHHRKLYREARCLIGHRPGIVVDNAVCNETSLDVAGYAIGWVSGPQARAVATEILRDAGHRLAKHWGIG